MDVQMPEMDGLDATKAIRRIPNLAQPRIVAMTANAMQGDREMCLAAGMDDYVSKPIRVQELVEAILRAKAANASPEVRASKARAPLKPAAKVRPKKRVAKRAPKVAAKKTARAGKR